MAAKKKIALPNERDRKKARKTGVKKPSKSAEKKAISRIKTQVAKGKSVAGIARAARLPSPRKAKKGKGSAGRSH